MRHMKKILTVLLAAVMLICMSVSAVWAEGEEVAQQTTADNMSFDVIFAIDGSGSMKKSDALKLRLTAGRLFTEMTYSNTSRAGFVQFTNIIMDSQGLTDLSTEDSKASFRDRLSGLQDSVKGSWDTDISLGLTQALNMLKEGDSFNGDRNPMIILLSDGNTDLPNGPRTVEESNAELTGTLSEAASLGVPIYSIGLNYDGKLDVDYMQNIANQTGGAFYNITTATDFNKYMTDIFGNVADGDLTGLNPAYIDGRFVTDFVIDNGSVLMANIVILTDKGVSDPQLIDPTGAVVPLDADHGVIVSTDTSDENKVSTYTILKIMYPVQGAWKVSVKGEADDAVQVNLLTTYDISFKLLNSRDPIAGNDINIYGKLVRGDENITDSNLLSGAMAICTIMDNKGNIVGENLPMTYNEEKHVFICKTNLEKSGNYYVTAHLEGKDGSFSKEAAQYQLSIGRAKLTVSGRPDVSMWCNPIKTKASVDISQHVKSESLAELNCSIEDNGNNIVTADYNKDTGMLNITPLRTGTGYLKLIFSDAYGQSAELTVFVTVKPSWIWFVAAIVILAVIVALIAGIMKATKPVLKDSVTVELSLPPMLANLTPSPATLAMPAKKSEVILGKLIQGDTFAQSTLGNPIMQAGLTTLVNKIKLVACKGDAVTVKILPKTPGMIMINNQNVDNAKGISYPMNKGDRIAIQFSTDGNSISTVTLQLGGEGGWDGNFEPGGDIFGGGQSGNPFGNNDFGSPFGGGGAGNFGDPFGGNTGNFGNPFGGAGGSYGSQPGGSNMGGFDGGQPGNNGMGGFDGNQPGNNSADDFGTGNMAGNPNDFGNSSQDDFGSANDNAEENNNFDFGGDSSDNGFGGFI
ncbi:VWA domain-containing protein [Blautia sp. MSK17_66]|uniref:VWA domain-containing protein n=1 Tax=Blautia TaxID=572511 RepID=UPI0015713ED8|nr:MULTISPECIES: VWA domain-containing protein [Blautia]MCB5549023.1 VWA domain-containing protein [Blautia sp. MSK17_66]NSK00699.1 VWA domain-containing protein [Blautia obeum]